MPLPYIKLYCDQRGQMPSTCGFTAFKYILLNLIKKSMRTVSGFFPSRLFIYLFYLFPICFTGKGDTAAASSQGVCRAFSCECRLTSNPVNLGWHAWSQNVLWAGR